MAHRATLVATPSLRYWRTQFAVPQRELAGMAKVSINTVQRLEAGGTARLTTIRRLAEALEIKPAGIWPNHPRPRRRRFIARSFQTRRHADVMPASRDELTATALVG